MVLDLMGEVAGQDVKQPAAGEVRRAEDLPVVPLPRVSLRVCSTENSCVPSGKCPQKMIEYAHTLRTRLAVMLPANTKGANGPASSGRPRSPSRVCRRVLVQISRRMSRLSARVISPARMRSVSSSCRATPYWKSTMSRKA